MKTTLTEGQGVVALLRKRGGVFLLDAGKLTRLGEETSTVDFLKNGVEEVKTHFLLDPVEFAMKDDKPPFRWRE